MSLLTNLVGYWKLDEASGSRLDSVGTSTFTESGGTVASTTGKLGNAASFSTATGAYLTQPDNATLSVGDIDFTFAAWVKIVDNTTGCLMLCQVNTPTPFEIAYEFQYTANATFSLLLSSAPNLVNATLCNANTFGTPVNNTWNHVVAWHDSVANQMGIAVNAGVPDTIAYTPGSFNSVGPITIGAAGGSMGNGVVDEVGFWKRVLTSQERTTLYNGGTGLSYPFTSAPKFLSTYGPGWGW